MTNKKRAILKKIKLNSTRSIRGSRAVGVISCSITRNIDLNELVKSMDNYNVKKIPLSITMKNNLDKLGISYAK